MWITKYPKGPFPKEQDEPHRSLGVGFNFVMCISIWAKIPTLWMRFYVLGIFCGENTKYINNCGIVSTHSQRYKLVVKDASNLITEPVDSTCLALCLSWW